MTATAGRVLVVGGTSKLGAAVVETLRHENRIVRASTRLPERAGHLQALGAEVVAADLCDRASLERACSNVDAVVASAHAFLGRGGNSPGTVDRDGHRNLIDAARAAAIEHFVYIGAMGACAHHPSDFFRIKHETEERLRASGLPYSILRGSVFMETWIEILGRSIASKGRAILFGHGATRWNYVSVHDLARFVSLSLRDSRLIDRTLDIGGPEDLTQSQLVDTIEHCVGRTVRRNHLPVPVLRSLSALVRPAHAGIGRMLEFGAFLGSTEMLFDRSELAEEFSIEPTRFEAVARRWVEREGAARWPTVKN